MPVHSTPTTSNLFRPAHCAKPHQLPWRTPFFASYAFSSTNSHLQLGACKAALRARLFGHNAVGYVTACGRAGQRLPDLLRRRWGPRARFRRMPPAFPRFGFVFFSTRFLFFLFSFSSMSEPTNIQNVYQSWGYGRDYLSLYEQQDALARLRYLI